MNYIPKDKLLPLLDTHFHHTLELEEYPVELVNAAELISWNRLDIAFKVFYLNTKDKNANFAKEVYLNHIRAFSFGKYHEAGNSEKNSGDAFLSEYNKIAESVANRGLSSAISVVPVDKNGTILNGAHRVSSALKFNKDVPVVRLNLNSHIYNYEFFYNRGVDRHLLDLAVSTFTQLASNVYIALIWPRAKHHDDEIDAVIPNIVYKKTVNLTPNGAHNLLAQVYKGEKWLGTRENNYQGVKGKLVQCFTNDDPLRVYAFQADSLEEVAHIKDQIRAIFKVGKHSVHITDTKEEAVLLSQMLFNDNSVHFLNHAKINKYLRFHSELDKFKKLVGTNVEDVVIDSGSVLALYGVRETRDLDYLHVNADQFGVYDAHDSELTYHDVQKADLIYNSYYHFYYEGLKFVSFKQVYDMKSRRNEEKDQYDIKMMEGLLHNNRYVQWANYFKQKWLMYKTRAGFVAIDFLKRSGFYMPIRSVYRFIKRK